MNYHNYIHSNAWLELREQRITEDDRCCGFCGNDEGPMHLHHLTYERLGRERHDDLILLCAGCHADAHEFPKRLQEIHRFAAARARQREVLSWVNT